MPTSNPLQLLANAINARQNPMALMQQMAAGDPRVAQVVEMIKGKSPQQLQQIATNMAQERGISINDLMRQLGINNASYR